MPAPQLTWNPDEARQNLARAEDLDRACKDAVRRDRDRVCAIVLACVPPGRRARLLAAIRSGEPAPEGK